MFCTNCGAEVDDAARFCTKCGTPLGKGGQRERTIPHEAPVAPASPEASEEPAGSKPTGKRRPRSKVAIVAIFVVLLLAGGGAAGYYFGIYAPAQRQAAAQKLSYERSHAKVHVTLAVSGDGWDTSAGASRLPVRVTGTNADGDYDEVQYVSSDGKGLELIAGSYGLALPASPVAADGGLYELPSCSITLDIAADTDVDPSSAEVPASPDEVPDVPDSDYDATSDGTITLNRANMATIGDDEVDAARKYLEADGELGADEVERLSNALSSARDDAQKKQTAEMEAAAKLQATDELLFMARATNYDDGSAADGSDSTSFKFERVQTSNAAGPLLTHAGGFWTVVAYSGSEEDAHAVAMYLFKLDLTGMLLNSGGWASLDGGPDGGDLYVAASGIYDSEAEAQAHEAELEAAGIRCGSVQFTGTRS